jgi:hypothetical protein
LYANANMIVFTEGSSLHALQLLGHLCCKVLVIARRPKRRFSRNILSTRVSSLHYIDHIRTFVPGLTSNGQPIALNKLLHGSRGWQYSGITVLNAQEFLSALDSHEINTSSWNPSEFDLHVAADISRWLEFQLRNGSFSINEKEKICANLFTLK